MFIQTEATPNPNAMKFLPGEDISPDNPVHFASKEDSISSPLARKLFAIHGISAVFFGAEFITITKEENTDWVVLKPEILVSIMDHLAAKLPIFTEQKAKKEIPQEYLSEIERQIVEIIETRVRPSVAMDGGDITYRGFENGVVTLELKGACSGCPSSSITLKNGIESMLKHYVPEVESVEAIQDSEE
jgi:Fe-S cluster biogenesis protein NfuA